MIVVTGAAGFIGYHLCRRLVRDGHRVAACDSFNDYYAVELKQARAAQLRADGLDVEHVDLSQRDSIDWLVAQRPDRVVHLAAQAGVRYSIDHPHAYAQANLVAFLNVLEAARALGVGHLVYASSSSVYGENAAVPFSPANPADHPVSLYAATKRANELMAHSYSHLYGLPTTGLRFFTVYGPWGRPDMAYFAFAQRMLDGEPLTVHGDGTAVRDFTYVDDVVEGLVRLLDLPPQPREVTDRTALTPDVSGAPFRVANIGHGGQASVNDLVDLLVRHLGVPARVEHGPVASGDVTRTWADTTTLDDLVGFVPRTGLEEGIARFADWFRAWHASPRAAAVGAGAR